MASVDRATLRERERKSRARQLARRETLRVLVTRLERALPIVLTLDNDDVAWNGFLDAQAMRIATQMRQLLQLYQQTQQLQLMYTQLHQILTEHRIVARVVAGLLHQSPIKEWERDVTNWRLLTRQYFQPWTIDECQDEIEAARKVINAFQWKVETQTTGQSFGWRDLQRLDSVHGIFQFQFQKIFPSDNMSQFMKIGWATYTDTDTNYEVVIGPRVQVAGNLAVGHRMCAYHEVVQELTPDMMIVRTDERYPHVAVDAHHLYLVFRIPVERGYTMGIRSIYCSELIKAMDGPADLWTSNMFWMQWEQITHDTFTFRLGGSLQGNDINYATQWMFEGLGCVLRYERLVTGQQWLKSMESKQ